jgi:DNA-binding winged helix-turn-helix (wHTH) protein
MQYVFGDHVLDSQRRELRGGGELVRLERKAFDVLLHLVRRRDHVVGAQELLAKVWRGAPVREGAVARCVAAAREALGDRRAARAAIHTLHGEGYRFVAPVVRSPAAAACVPPRQIESELDADIPERFAQGLRELARRTAPVHEITVERLGRRALAVVFDVPPPAAPPPPGRRGRSSWPDSANGRPERPPFMTRGAASGAAFLEMPTRGLTPEATNDGAGRCVMRARRTYGAALALWLLASLGGLAGVWPRVAAAQETAEGLRQGLIQVADLIGGMSPDAAGEAAALRTKLTEAEPDVLAAMQAELSRRPAWKGTGQLLQTLAPLTAFRAPTAAATAAATAPDCSNPTLECPDQTAQCADGQKKEVKTHIDLFISEKTFEFVAIGLEATCGAVSALLEEIGTPFCIAAGATNLVIRLLTIPAEISDICGGGELEADILNSIISQTEATKAEVNALQDKLGAVEALENLRVEAALASCTKISTLMLPESSLTGTTSTDLEGSFLRTLDLVQALFNGAKRAGVLSPIEISTTARELGTARANFDQRKYAEGFKDLCDAYQPLK